jgi:hypothetical protein
MTGNLWVEINLLLRRAGEKMNVMVCFSTSAVIKHSFNYRVWYLTDLQMK